MYIKDITQGLTVEQKLSKKLYTNNQGSKGTETVWLIAPILKHAVVMEMRRDRNNTYKKNLSTNGTLLFANYFDLLPDDGGELRKFVNNKKKFAARLKNWCGKLILIIFQFNKTSISHFLRLLALVLHPF